MSEAGDPEAPNLGSDHMTSLMRDAIAMHEILTALLEAGWTERQAIIYIVELGHRHRE